MKDSGDSMTPKIIHYVWVGGAPKPPIVLHCIESWRNMCPDWELREWNDSTMGDIGNRYVQEAYSHRKWAFVADWMRLNVLYRYGGFYLDTDMELLKPIDRFLENDLTMGLVDRHGKVLFNGGFIGCRMGDDVIGGLLAEYDHLPFVKSDGELDLTPNTVRMVDYFGKRWKVCPKSANDTIDMGGKRIIYPASFFLSRQGYSFHHYCASWLDDWTRKVWMSVGPYKLVRFKRRMESSSPTPTLRRGESALGSIPLGRRKKVFLIRRCDHA